MIYRRIRLLRTNIFRVRELVTVAKTKVLIWLALSHLKSVSGKYSGQHTKKKKMKRKRKNERKGNGEMK